jgi:integrase
VERIELPEMRKSGKIALSAGNHGMGWRETRGTIKYLTKEQLRALFRAIPKDNIRDRLLFNLMYLHGLRRGEAAILSLDGLRDGRIYIARLKKGKSQWYDLFPSTLSLLRRYLAVRPKDGCRFLFRGRRKACTPLSGRTIDELFRTYAARAGLPEDLRHCHTLRHSIGVHMANEGFDISDVGDHLGHSDLTSTAIYFQVTDKRRAANYRRMLRSREIVHG